MNVLEKLFNSHATSNHISENVIFSNDYGVYAKMLGISPDRLSSINPHYINKLDLTRIIDTLSMNKPEIYRALSMYAEQKGERRDHDIDDIDMTQVVPVRGQVGPEPEVPDKDFYYKTIRRLDRREFRVLFPGGGGFIDYKPISTVFTMNASPEMDEMIKMAIAIKGDPKFRNMRYNDIFSVLMYTHYKEYAKRNDYLTRAKINRASLHKLVFDQPKADELLEAIASKEIYVGLFDPIRFIQTHEYGGFDIIILLVVHGETMGTDESFEFLFSDTCTVMEASPCGSCHSTPSYRKQAIMANIHRMRDDPEFLQSLQTELRSMRREQWTGHWTGTNSTPEWITRSSEYIGWNIVKGKMHNRSYSTDDVYNEMIVVYAEHGPFSTGQHLDVQTITSRRKLFDLLVDYKAPLILDTSCAQVCGNGEMHRKYFAKSRELGLSGSGARKRLSRRRKRKSRK